MNSFPLHAKMLTGLILCQVFFRETELLWAWECSRPIVFRTHCSALGLTIFLPLLCNGLCALGKRYCLDAPSVAVPSNDTYSLYLWLVMNFRANHPRLHKETALMGPESFTNLWVEIYEFREQLDAMPILQNNSREFTAGACELLNHGFLARFTVPGVCSLLWNRTYI